MKLDDVALVMGLQNPITELIEVMCRSIGFKIVHAMSQDEPTRRISALNEKAVLSEALPDNVLRVGFMLPASIVDRDMDCHFADSADMARAVFEWIANRVNAPDELPANWSVVQIPEAQKESVLWSSTSGTVLKGGQLVFDQLGNKQVMQIPELYRDLYSLVERNTI